ncbi:MAG: AAA family ATPase, partial [Pseudomonadota bacterium]|nr:AAA family ATPase [Pseudomonadota bacterium]
EVEKAHPDVFNILLQVLDDGRLTDGQGRTIDFKNTVIIMTSNLGSDVIQEQASNNDYQGLKNTLMSVIGQHFRPEFINRIDETVVFHPLAQAHIENIAKIQLQRLEQRLQDNGYQLELTDAALAKIAEAGFDPVFGARPLKRAIQQTIENPLAQTLLSGEFKAGSCFVVDCHDGEIAIASK